MIRKFSITAQTSINSQETTKATSSTNTDTVETSENKLYANSLESTENSIVNGHTINLHSCPKDPLLYPIGSSERDTSTDEGLSMSEEEDHLAPEHPDLTKMLNDLDIDHKLMSASQRGDTNKVRELLTSGAQVITDESGTTAIHIASQNGFAEVVRLLLESGIDVDLPDSGGYSALHKAAGHGHLDVLELLINEGCDIDTQDDMYGNTPLHEAAWQGYSKSVDLLLKSKSNSFITNRAGCTPLHLAAQNGHNQSGRILLYSGCSPDVKNNYGDTPLHTAARYGHAGIARILISAKCSIDEQNKNGDTALHITAAFKRRKIATLLVEARITIQLKNKQGETAIDIARRKDHPEIIDIIHDGQTMSMPPHAKSHNHRVVKPEYNSYPDTRPGIKPTPEIGPVDKKAEKSKKHNAFVSWIRKVFTGKDKSANSKSKPVRGDAVGEASDDVSPGLVSQYVKKPGFAYYRDLAGNVRQGPCGFVPACHQEPEPDELNSSKRLTYENLQETQNVLRERIETIQRQTSHLNTNKGLDEGDTRLKPVPRARPITNTAVEKERQEINKQLALVESDLQELRGDLASWLQTQADDSTDRHDKPMSNGLALNRDNPFAYAVGRSTTRFGDDFDHERMARYEMTEQFPPPPRLFRTRSDETLSHSEYSYHGRAFKSREAAMAELKTLKQHEEMRAKRKLIRAGIDDSCSPKMLEQNQSLLTKPFKVTNNKGDLTTSIDNVNFRNPRHAVTLDNRNRNSLTLASNRLSLEVKSNGISASSTHESDSNSGLPVQHEHADLAKRVTPIGSNETNPQTQEETGNGRAQPTYKLISEALNKHPITPVQPHLYTSKPDLVKSTYTPSSSNRYQTNSISLQKPNLYLEQQLKPFNHNQRIIDGMPRSYQQTTPISRNIPSQPIRKPHVDTPVTVPPTPRRVLPSYNEIQMRRNPPPAVAGSMYGSQQQIPPKPRARPNLYNSNPPRPLSPQTRIPANATKYGKPGVPLNRSISQPSTLAQSNPLLPKTNDSCCSSSNPDSGYGGAVNHDCYLNQSTPGAKATQEYDSWYNQKLQDAARRMNGSTIAPSQRAHKQITSDV